MTSRRRVTGMLMAAAAALMLSVAEADAAPTCKADGATCRKNANCCSEQCLKTVTTRKTPGICVSGNPNGQACSTNSECISGHCADGVCCNTACAGSCNTCEGGTCAPRPAGEDCDDGLFCTATDTCDGAGTCLGSGTTCPLESQSDDCSECDETTDACSQSEGNTCGLANGQACSEWYQCDTGYCVDGVCCESSCSDTCQACTAEKTSWPDGTCAPINGQTDPDDECDDTILCVTGFCNGQGSCGAVEWMTDPRDECPDDPCVTGMCDGGGGCGVLASDTPCDNGEACSQTDRCDGFGECVGTGNGCPMTPDGQNQCTCDEISDSCSYEESLCVP